MRRLLPLVFAVLAPLTAAAQDAPRPAAEIGAQGAVGFVRGGGGSDWVSVIELPASSQYGLGALYATLFASPRLAVEPQVSAVRVAYGGESATQLQLNLQLMQFFDDPSANATYGGAHVGVASSFAPGGGGTATAFLAGGALGYRVVVRESLGIRFEGRYRRWFGDAERDEIALVVGLGGILHRRPQ